VVRGFDVWETQERGVQYVARAASKVLSTWSCRIVLASGRVADSTKTSLCIWAIENTFLRDAKFVAYNTALLGQDGFRKRCLSLARVLGSILFLYTKSAISFVENLPLGEAGIWGFLKEFQLVWVVGMPSSRN